MSIKPSHAPTREEMKLEAIYRMKLLKLPERFIQMFEEENKVVAASELFGLTIPTPLQELAVKKYEQAHDALCYMVFQIFSDDEEVTAVLRVSNKKENWETERENVKNGFLHTYVVDMDSLVQPNAVNGFDLMS